MLGCENRLEFVAIGIAIAAKVNSFTNLSAAHLLSFTFEEFHEADHQSSSPVIANHGIRPARIQLSNLFST